MARLFNRAFKVGFIVTLAFFAMANIGTYLLAVRRYDELTNRPIAFAPAARLPGWGFPFKWDGYNVIYSKSNAFSDLFSLADGLVLNFLTIAACGFLIGLLFRWFKSRYE